jgi:predicted nucleic acid-binding Zn ribbon protein
MADPKKPAEGAENQDFAQEFYWQMREAVTGRLSRDAKRIAAKAAKNDSQPFDKGRDPVTAGNSINEVMKSFRWESQLSEADLFNRWAELVGETNAASTHPEALVNGTLTIRCKSTAWATQLRLMQAQILGRINEAYPDLEITSLKLLGPDAPSWKKGPRSVPGRGPRDTYG